MSTKNRTSISIRIETSVLEWFKQQKVNGYQTLINEVLNKHVDKVRMKQEHAAGRAQEIFKSHHAKCFWHYDPKLEITSKNINLVIDGLRKHGGHQGLLLAEELCQ